MEKQKATIEFNEDEVNIILEALSKEPYIKVFELINKIRTDFIRQNSNGTEVENK